MTPLARLTTCRDDENITVDDYLEPTQRTAPILSGFYYISKLFRCKLCMEYQRRTDDLSHRTIVQQAQAGQATATKR